MARTMHLPRTPELLHCLLLQHPADTSTCHVHSHTYDTVLERGTMAPTIGCACGTASVTSAQPAQPTLMLQQNSAASPATCLQNFESRYTLSAAGLHPEKIHDAVHTYFWSVLCY